MSTAGVNIQEQEGLLAALQGAYEASGLTMETVAERLGITQELAQEALFGGRDLSMTELRHIALVLNVVIGYTVRKPTATEDVPVRPRRGK